ncbi:hypothetical protein B5X24_HaOG210107 [Helicoverpa armigera]|uniref:Uncharacterized protein n=1 Tax=Helicoverpa armigera TaxID=29058 RepID=A0A2W1BK37_HELAM|nr:hypothetical protein B5X24_HaOG210107 [Helicoverpa armigera]
MSFLNKTYKFVKQENLDGFLKAIGFPEEKITPVLSFTPDQKYTKEGDSYKYVTQGLDGPREVTFKSGVEFDDLIGPEKVPAKTTYVVDGNKIIQTVKSSFGVGTFTREFVGDDLFITMELEGWNGVAKRQYKAA